MLSRKSIVAIEILCFSRLFLPATNCYLTYRDTYSVTFNFFEKHFFLAPILHFHSPTFVLIFFLFFVFSICGNKLQDFCSIKYIFLQIFLPFQQFVTLNSLDILILEFSWNLIPVTFPLKVAKTFSQLSRHFL